MKSRSRNTSRRRSRKKRRNKRRNRNRNRSRSRRLISVWRGTQRKDKKNDKGGWKMTKKDGKWKR